MYVTEPHSVRFSWSAPFSLNITDYEPDILYYFVNIITVDDNTAMNTTDTVYLLEPDLCLFSEYRAEIAAVNIVGMGEKYTSPPLSLEGISIYSLLIFWSRYTFKISCSIESVWHQCYPWQRVSSNQHPGTVILYLVYSCFRIAIKFCSSLQISSSCLEGIYYNIELIPTHSTKKVVISNSSSVGQTLILSSPDIQLNEYYEAIVRIERSTFLHHLEISMYELCSSTANDK